MLPDLHVGTVMPLIYQMDTIVGKAAFHLASLSGSQEIVKTLLDMKADIDIQVTDIYYLLCSIFINWLVNLPANNSVQISIMCNNWCKYLIEYVQIENDSK